MRDLGDMVVDQLQELLGYTHNFPFDMEVRFQTESGLYGIMDQTEILDMKYNEGFVVSKEHGITYCRFYTYSIRGRLTFIHGDTTLKKGDIFTLENVTYEDIYSVFHFNTRINIKDLTK